jgi:hypothetical protein
MDSKFVIFPVRLFYFDGTYWRPTGRWAWRKRVNYMDTIWGERFYFDTPPTSEQE